MTKRPKGKWTLKFEENKPDVGVWPSQLEACGALGVDVGWILDYQFDIDPWYLKKGLTRYQILEDVPIHVIARSRFTAEMEQEMDMTKYAKQSGGESGERLKGSDLDRDTDYDATVDDVFVIPARTWDDGSTSNEATGLRLTNGQWIRLSPTNVGTMIALHGSNSDNWRGKPITFHRHEYNTGAGIVINNTAERKTASLGGASDDDIPF